MGAACTDRHAGQHRVPLGLAEETAALIDRWAAKGEQLRLFEVGYGRMHMDSRYSGADALLVLASGLELHHLEQIMREGAEAWEPLFQSLEAIFLDLVRQCGARTT
jgi:hypothetical protein